MPVPAPHRTPGQPGQSSTQPELAPSPELVPRPDVPAWEAWATSKTTKAEARGRLRSLNAFDARGPRGRLATGQEVVSFAGNDYLGLSAHPAVISASHQALDRWGTGASASRLVTGTRPVHADLEAALAAWKGCEACLVYPSGFAANLGVLTALAGPGVAFFGDRANHASIIDGTRLAMALGAHVDPYPHLDMEALGSRLEAWPGRAVVVSDAVFSMDGDLAPVGRLAELCARHDALLVLDEAHSVLAPLHLELPGTVLRVGTLSKTLGSLGGFVAGARSLVDMLVNRSRSFIYTTALSPADAAAAQAALGVLRSSEGELLLARLRGYAERAKAGQGHVSPIFPVVVGPEAKALAASAALLARGLLVPAIRPPTVAPGTSRLRVSLSAAHSGTEVEMLLSSLTEIGLDLSGTGASTGTGAISGTGAVPGAGSA